jgi:hypothetical protein
VTMRPEPPSAVRGEAQRPLKDGVVALAGMADDDPEVSPALIAIARLTADRTLAVSYASVTARRAGALTTVATSSEMALAVDEAQYADGAGPCLETFDTGTVTAVPDVGATMQWPGFRDAAFGLGLRASLSVPLFAGRGDCVAVLNLYSHDPTPMGALTAAVWETYEAASGSPDGSRHHLDDGGAELVAGLTGAFAVRDVIQQAIGRVIAEQQVTADAAYLTLRAWARENGSSLVDTATTVLAAQHD